MLTLLESPRVKDTPKPNEYKAIEKAIAEYNQTSTNNTIVQNYMQLNEINKLIETFHDMHSQSGRRHDLFELQKTFPKILDELIKKDRQPMPKELLYIWIGGMLPNEDKGYINLWRQLHPDYNIKVYYDSKCLLASTLKSRLINFCTKQTIQDKFFYGYNKDDEHLFFIERMRLIHKYQKNLEKRYEDNKLKFTPDQIIIDFLAEELKQDRKELTELRLNIEQSFRDTELYTDINKLDGLFIDGDKVLKYNYYCELVKRNNMAAASDILRLELLQQHGGMYLDTDILPPLNEDAFRILDNNKNNSTDRLAIIEYALYKNGFGDDSIFNAFNKISAEKKAIIKADVDKLGIEKIFRKMDSQVLFISQLEILGRYSPLNNNMFAAQAKSYGIKFFKDNIKFRYNELNTALAQYIDSNIGYQEIGDRVYRKIAERYNYLTSNKSDPVIDGYLEACRQYLTTGFIPLVHSTMHLTGPYVLDKAISNLYMFEPDYVQNGTLDPRTFEAFNLPDSIAEFVTPEGIKSSWTTTYDEASNYYLKAYKEVFPDSGALDEDGHLNKDEWKIITDEILKDKITSAGLPQKDYDKYDHHCIVQWQGDSVSYEAALNLFAKQYKTASILQQKYFNSFYCSNTDPLTIDKQVGIYTGPEGKGKNIKLSFIGHGDRENGNTFGGSTVETLVNEFMNIFDQIFPKDHTAKIHLNLVGCSMISTENSLKGQFVGILAERLMEGVAKYGVKPEQIEVSANRYVIRVNKEGRTEVLDHSGKWVTKEYLAAQDIMSKQTIFWNTKTKKIDVKSKDIVTIAELNERIEEIILNSPQSDEIEKLKASSTNLMESITKQVTQCIVDIEPSALKEKMHEIKLHKELMDKLGDDLYNLYSQNNLSSNYVIIWSSIEKKSDKYDITFVDKKTGEKKVVQVEDPLFFDFKGIIDGYLGEFGKDVTFNDHGLFIPDTDINIDTPPSTLNAALFIQTMLDYHTIKGDFVNLSDSIQLEVYASVVQGAIDILQDVTDLVDFIAEALKKPIKILGKISNVIGKFSSFIDVFNIGLLIKKLIEADDEIERQLIITELAMGSIEFSLALIEVAATALGLAGISSILSAVTLPIAGIMIGLPSLIGNLIILASENDAFRKFFGHIYDVMEIETFPYKIEKQGTEENKIEVESFIEDIVVEEINFKTGQIVMGDIQICGFKGGSGHTVTSGFDHFFAAPHPDWSNYLSVYTPMKIKKNYTLKHQSPVIILPSGIKRKMKTVIAPVAGVRYKNDSGAKALDMLRGHYGIPFTWRFYATLFDYSVTEVQVEYIHTDVRVVLSEKNDKTMLMVPSFDRDFMAKNIQYTLVGDGHNYNVVLPQCPVDVILECNANDKWHLGISELVWKYVEVNEGENPIKELIKGALNQQNFEIRKDYIRIGKQYIYINNNPKSIQLSFNIDDYTVIIDVNLKYDPAVTELNIPYNIIFTGKCPGIDQSKYIPEFSKKLHTLGIYRENVKGTNYIHSEVGLSAYGTLFANTNELVYCSSVKHGDEDDGSDYTRNQIWRFYDGVAVGVHLNGEEMNMLHGDGEDILLLAKFKHTDGTYPYTMTYTKKAQFVPRTVTLTPKHIKQFVLATSNTQRIGILKDMFGNVPLEIREGILVSGTTFDGNYYEYRYTALGEWKLEYSEWIDNDLLAIKYQKLENDLIVSNSTQIDHQGMLINSMVVTHDTLNAHDYKNVIITPEPEVNTIEIAPAVGDKAISIYVGERLNKPRLIRIDDQISSDCTWSCTGSDIILYKGNSPKYIFMEALGNHYYLDKTSVQFNNTDSITLFGIISKLKRI